MTLFLYCLLYFALHSTLASGRLKALVRRRFTAADRWYRMAYNGFAAGGLAWLLWQLARQPVDYWFEPGPAVRYLGAGLAAAGAGVLWMAFKPYNTREFFGLEQMSGIPAPPPVLHTGGLNAWVRHPLYFGTLVLLAGGWLLFPTRAATAVLASVVLYLPVGIYFEENKLLQQFGAAYRDYQKRVKRLIPLVW